MKRIYLGFLAFILGLSVTQWNVSSLWAQENDSFKGEQNVASDISDEDKFANLLKQMEGRITQLEKEYIRMKDFHEIQNLMGWYVYMHEANRYAELFKTAFAEETPGVSVEVANGGVFLSESLPKLEKKTAEIMEKFKKGSLYVHPLTTPVLEIAGDGKTAKGVWMSPGYEAGGNDPETNKPIPAFVYTKYGVDFVKENGKWKIWHYHVYRVFMTPWNIPITEEWEKNEREKLRNLQADENDKPDLPTTYDNPYSVDTVRELVPAPPEPYETFSETFSYGP